ncbi:phosphatase IMPL1, chloroplastic-like [Gossypium australe]|uniref:Phosphatase IMPL1, chloroplastic-like n=1 Tax=Gossypium australe TaxID=47621 RepID=A0A5B6X4V0_9ROSI|nr:phosphatase IMPL1, chloroplastic-like [Gossypium australe]
MSEASNQRKYPKVGAKSTGSIPPSELIEVVEAAARAGAEVVMDAVNKPRNVTYKGLADLVTESFDPRGGRRNYREYLIRLSLVEFVGGPMCWNTRTYTATAGGGAFCNGQKIHPSKTDKGVRRLGGAAVDMCHVALGVTEGYWEYRLKPWDIAAAVLKVR